METNYKPEQKALIPYIFVKALGKFENIYEVRLFAWILAKAQSVLKLYNKDLKTINVQHAMNLVELEIPARYILPDNDHDYKNIKKAFSLAEKTIEYETDDYTYNLNIVAFPHLQKRGRERMFKCVLHQHLWMAMMNFAKGHRLVNLSVFLTLKNVNAMILYIIISQQDSTKQYSVETLRELFGAKAESYRLINNLLRRYLNPAKAELDKHSPYTCTFRPIKGRGRGGKTAYVLIEPQPNPNYKPTHSALTAEINAQRLRLDNDVRYYMESHFLLTTEQIAKLEPLLHLVGDKEAQMSKLLHIYENSRRVKVHSLPAYVRTSLQNP